MNINNNLINNNNFIGSTHNDYYKITSNFILTTSNILEEHLSNTSNILDIKASNFTTITSNLILNRYDKLISEKNEEIIFPPTTLKHTYITNSNIGGEIRFYTENTKYYPVINPFEVPEYRTKIDLDGKLKIYYTYDPLISLTFGNGWIDIANSIVNLNSSDANFVITITGIQAEISNNYNLLQQQIIALIFAQEEFTIVTDFQRDQIYNRVMQQADFVRTQQTSMPLALASIREATLTGLPQYIRNGINIATGIITNNPLTTSFLGATGAVFYFLANKIYEQEYKNRSLGLLYSNVSNMIGITETKRNELFSNIGDEKIRSLINITSNEYNINLIQGFINSNITTQQYISNLKCDNLYLNNGNVSGINYVNVNNIVADGRIKENNKFLDTTYLTSNHIYNLAYNYTTERQYPPKAYDTTSVEDTVSLLGKLVYHQILYLDSNSITHGSGFYEIYSSSTYDNGITNKDKLFNFNYADTINARWGISLYNSGTGNYQGDNSIDGSYYGDWIIIKLPQSIMLTKFRFYTGGTTTRSPAEWKCYGSNDGITFIEITEGSQSSRLTTGNYSSGYYEKSLNPSFTTLYKYIGFTIGKIVSISGNTDLCFGEIQLYGKEILSNTIVSNIYATSNAVKNIILYDTNEVCKHFAFYILINTPIVINNTTYYKYDIDLRQYTKKGYIQIGGGSNDPYRVFKIRAFYGTSYFGTLIGGLPDVVYADVFMSYKAAGTELGQAGLNICSIGNISNPTLTSVPPNNLFFMRNGTNSIDYITVVSKSAADVRVIIEDLLG